MSNTSEITEIVYVKVITLLGAYIPEKGNREQGELFEMMPGEAEAYIDAHPDKYARATDEEVAAWLKRFEEPEASADPAQEQEEENG